jgi:hypothetical protein
MTDTAPAEPVYEVVSPVPAQRVDRPPTAPALPNLDGKTVAFLWDSLFDGDRCFEAISARLSEEYTGVTFVGYDVFGDIHGRDEKLARYRVDAAIVGVGA